MSDLLLLFSIDISQIDLVFDLTQAWDLFGFLNLLSAAFFAGWIACLIAFGGRYA